MPDIRNTNTALIESAFQQLDMAVRGLLAMEPKREPQFDIKVSGGWLSVSAVGGVSVTAAKRFLQRSVEQANEKNRLIKAIDIEPYFPTFHVAP